jgi:hypothetical protein
MAVENFAPAEPLHAETYSLFQWNVEDDPGSLNPFDPEEASFEGVFVPPNGSPVTVPGFWTQDFDPMEHKTPVGKPHWCLRYCPTQAWNHTFTTTLRFGKNVSLAGPQTLVVTPSQNTGFVRSNARNGLYFTLSTGESFYPLGLSVAWTSREHLLEDYEHYFSHMGDNGGNLTRVWTCEWNLPLEWSFEGSTPGQPKALGRYHLDSACLLDEVLASARRHHLKVILTLNTYGELMDEKGPWNEQSWTRNPYCKLNGGPCIHPWDYFTDPTARKFYKKRLRYIAARWGWSPDLFGVEFFNEVNVPHDWAKEMAEAYQSYDPNHHLVSTSVAWPWSAPYDENILWRTSAISPVMKHYYGFGSGGSDIAEEVRTSSLEQSRKFHKPFFYEEIGLDPMKDDASFDLKGQGTHLHNAFWAAATSLSAAAPLSHWKEYFDQMGLYRELKSLRPFVDSVDWGGPDWNPFEEAQTLEGSSGVDSSLRIPLDGDWNAKPSEKIWVSSDGSLEGHLAAFLKTTARSSGTTVLIETYAPHAITLTLKVEQVSTGAVLKTWIDGKSGPTWSFDPKPGSGNSYQETHKDPKWNVDVATYHQDCTFAIPKGRHEIKLENQGADWLKLEEAFVLGIHPPIRIKLYGLASDQTIVGWIQDKRSEWQNVYRKGWVPTQVRGLKYRLNFLKAGTWNLQWWNTRTGVSTSAGTQTISNGIFELNVPDFSSDTAFLLTKTDKP